MNILDKLQELTWQKWRRVVNPSQSWPFASLFKHGIFISIFLLMTFVAILLWITGPNISVCLGKLNSQVPKHCLIKEKAQWNTVKAISLQQNQAVKQELCKAEIAIRVLRKYCQE